MRPATVRKIVDEISPMLNTAAEEGGQPVLLISSTVRRYFKQLIERSYPRLPVLSFNEIVSGIEVHSLGNISTEVLM